MDEEVLFTLHADGPTSAGLFEVLNARRAHEPQELSVWVGTRAVVTLSEHHTGAWLTLAAEHTVDVLEGDRWDIENRRRNRRERSRLRQRIREAMLRDPSSRATIFATIFITAWRLLNARTNYVMLEALVRYLVKQLPTLTMRMQMQEAILAAIQDFDVIYPDRPEIEENGWPEHPDFFPSLLAELRADPLWEEMTRKLGPESVRQGEADDQL